MCEHLQWVVNICVYSENPRFLKIFSFDTVDRNNGLWCTSSSPVWGGCVCVCGEHAHGGGGG